MFGHGTIDEEKRNKRWPEFSIPQSGWDEGPNILRASWISVSFHCKRAVNMRHVQMNQMNQMKKKRFATRKDTSSILLLKKRKKL